ncbi:MAG TPA: hypothetical protein P5080_00335 [Candidatus Paceibacterota bacterium]|nr:hypothetical protein [Candidatus Pacearchaeota archaeon]HRZ50422.1 hypothetical protein [Candidatus Paceibacterota bacterium]HSA36143.1 hypothetical protein [Candidatus Paceibacterota bacterium]
MQHLIERVKALEDQHGASDELIEILLEFADVFGEETGRNVLTLKRKINALKQSRPDSGQARI